MIGWIPIDRRTQQLKRPMSIPFNKPYMTGKELWYISQAHAQGHLAGDGSFSRKCSQWLEQTTGTRRALLTHSCTAALEMAAILADIGPGDEVIMPSYTFVSTANAFVLRGAVPVFVDIRPDTLNIDETKIEAAITPRTKAIVPVHYAGVGCEMDTIMDIARRHGLMVIEDAAQGIMSTYNGRPLGTIGHLGALSFHETKNIISGEGGALLINDMTLAERAEIIREKGTNRARFFRGQVDKYTWVDIGSSYLPSELIAAVARAAQVVRQETAGDAPAEAPEEDAPPHTRLTSRENEVFMLILMGRQVVDIAAELDVHASTVSNHLAKVRQKLGVRTTQDLVHYAYAAGILERPPG